MMFDEEDNNLYERIEQAKKRNPEEYRKESKRRLYKGIIGTVLSASLIIGGPYITFKNNTTIKDGELEQKLEKNKEKAKGALGACLFLFGVMSLTWPLYEFSLYNTFKIDKEKNDK